MTIKIGESLPAGKLWELPVEWTAGCPTAPDEIDVATATRGKRIVVFALPGAYTRVCSASHLPGYVQHAAALKAKRVDEIWCLSVNDAMVMGAWGKDNAAAGKVRMIADGNGVFTKALGLEMDLTARGMGVRSQRYSMLVEDGVVKSLNLEQPGKFDVSGAEAMLTQL
ncbi:MAG: peroxiredoxin [Betaproteobacteria bacterium]|jgi:peroxiredoxin